jgi:hypothetical protein
VANHATFVVYTFCGGFDKAANAALESAAMATLPSAVNMYFVAEVLPAFTVGAIGFQPGRLDWEIVLPKLRTMWALVFLLMKPSLKVHMLGPVGVEMGVVEVPDVSKVLLELAVADVEVGTEANKVIDDDTGPLVIRPVQT